MQDLDRIRFVTANYYDLHGLRWVVWGIVCFAVAAEDGGLIPTWALLALMIPFGIAAFLGASQYYIRRYGSVVSGAKRPSLIMSSFAAIAVLIIARLLDDVLEVRPFLSPFAWAVWFLASFWLVGRKYRSYYLWIAIAVCLANAAFSLIEFPAGSLWLRTGVVTWTLIAVAMIIGGLMDHSLLVKTLKPAVEAQHV